VYFYMFAPYTDTTLWPTFDISSVSQVNDFTLGFVVADYDNEPSWGGYYPVASDFYSDIISKVKKNKGRLICSFGGADGNELATVIEKPNDIFAAYDKVIRKHNFKFVDFDIEGSALYNTVANKKRATAIRNLKKKYKDLHVSLTVPVMPYGLEKDVLNLVDKTPHDLINIMTMNFGNEANMYRATVDAVLATRKQVKADLGVTIMIGKNDTPETFTLKDAENFVNFAREYPYIKRVSIWSLERDAGIQGELAHSSQQKQKPWAYSKLFSKIY
jgi:chitinase